MELLLIILLGLLYAAGVYFILRRSMVKLLFGILLLGSGANILIFLLGGITKGKPPVIAEDAKLFQDVFADPVPQALILTAIVISFAMIAFAIVLDDLDDLNTPEEEDI